MIPAKTGTIVAVGPVAPGSPPFRVLHAREYPGVPATIPWALIEPHAAQARTNHMQTLQRLNERGGLSPDEMVAVLDDRRWRAMTREEAAARLLEILANVPSEPRDE